MKLKKFFFSSLILSLLGLLFPAAALAATLSLSPASATLNKGCNYSIGISLDTQSVQTDGTDSIIRFDPTRISPTNITPGTIYADYPGTNIDSTGKITISGLASVSQPFTGSGTLAIIDLNIPATAPTGATSMTFDFDPQDPSKTTDSNVVERGTVKDVLTSVTNGSYSIGTGACTQLNNAPTTGGSSTTTTGGSSTTGGKGAVSTSTSGGATKTLPPAGSSELTFTLVIVGSALTVIGILGLALL